jgi:hypothetical protein
MADAVPDLMCTYGLQSYDAMRDAGSAVSDATLHTTRPRLPRTRARRRAVGCG